MKEALSLHTMTFPMNVLSAYTSAPGRGLLHVLALFASNSIGSYQELIVKSQTFCD